MIGFIDEMHKHDIFGDLKKTTICDHGSIRKSSKTMDWINLHRFWNARKIGSGNRCSDEEFLTYVVRCALLGIGVWNVCPDVWVDSSMPACFTHTINIPYRCQFVNCLENLVNLQLLLLLFRNPLQEFEFTFDIGMEVSSS